MILVFDIGGTNTRAGLFDRARGALLRTTCAPTPNHLDLPAASFNELRERLVSLMVKLAAELKPEPLPRQINVAFAGPIDPAGEVLAAPTLWGTRLERPYPLARDLASAWPGARIALLNDVTAAGYRYQRSSNEELCVVTVSSGIGNKVFLGGRPMLGRSGAGGELGHLKVDDSPAAPLCECGGRGHLGALASGRGALEHARQRSNDAALTSGDLVAAFRRGEPWALESIACGARHLGRALASLHLGLGLERFILIGGFALALGEAYRQLVAEAAQASCWRGVSWQGRVELGVDDDLSGLIGAGLAAEPQEQSL